LNLKAHTKALSFSAVNDYVNDYLFSIQRKKGLEKLGLQLCSLSDVEEDIEDIPEKQFDSSPRIYTNTEHHFQFATFTDVFAHEIASNDLPDGAENFLEMELMQYVLSEPLTSFHAQRTRHYSGDASCPTTLCGVHFATSHPL